MHGHLDMDLGLAKRIKEVDVDVVAHMRCTPLVREELHVIGKHVIDNRNTDSDCSPVELRADSHETSKDNKAESTLVRSPRRRCSARTQRATMFSQSPLPLPPERRFMKHSPSRDAQPHHHNINVAATVVHTSDMRDATLKTFEPANSQSLEPFS